MSVICANTCLACHDVGTDPETGEVEVCPHATPHERRADCPPQYCFVVAQEKAPCVRFERVKEET